MNEENKQNPPTVQNQPTNETQPEASPVNTIQSPTTAPVPQANPSDTNKPDATQKKSGFPIKTFLLILVLAAVTAGLLYVALKQNPASDTNVQQPITNATPVLENPAQTTLGISSTPVRLSTPSAYSTNITINTGKNVVNKVQLEISFDPKLITNVSIENGRFFTNPQVLLKNVDAINGRVTFAIGVQDGEEGLLGQGVVAKLNFSATQKVATTSVKLLPKTQVSADGYSQSVLKTTIDALFNLNETPFKATTSAK